MIAHISATVLVVAVLVFLFCVSLSEPYRGNMKFTDKLGIASMLVAMVAGATALIAIIWGK